jgi:hypothetical protein
MLPAKVRMTETPEPELLLHDATLASAPLEVRRESDWIARNNTAVKLSQLAIGAAFFAGFPLAGAVATLAGSEGVGALAMLGLWASLAAAMPFVLRSPRQQRYQQAVQRIEAWRRLSRHQADAAAFGLAPPSPEPGLAQSFEQLVARIEALSEAAPVRDGARRGLDRARALAASRAQVASTAAQSPEAEARLKQATERIDDELARIEVALTELWTRLLEAPADADPALADALRYLDAEAEVLQAADPRLPKEEARLETEAGPSLQPGAQAGRRDLSRSAGS